MPNFRAVRLMTASQVHLPEPRRGADARLFVVSAGNIRDVRAETITLIVAMRKDQASTVVERSRLGLRGA